MSKCLVLFVEGDTEIEFYKRLILTARNRNTDGRLDINIEYKNVKGFGGFKNSALRKFIKEIIPKYDKKCKYSVVLCRDTDVFELSPKPPIDWDEVESAFLKNGAHKVIHIKAKSSIEDWFLLDAEGIISFLRLPKKTKISGSNGYDKMKKLYKKANKIYFKGMKSNGMIGRLDIDKIVGNLHSELDPLFTELGIKKV